MSIFLETENCPLTDDTSWVEEVAPSTRLILQQPSLPSVHDVMAPFLVALPPRVLDKPAQPVTWRSLSGFRTTELFPFEPTFKNLWPTRDDYDHREDRKYLFIQETPVWEFEVWCEEWKAIEYERDTIKKRKDRHVKVLNKYLTFIEHLPGGESGYLLTTPRESFLDTKDRWCDSPDFFLRSNPGFYQAPPKMYIPEFMKKAALIDLFDGMEIKPPSAAERAQGETPEEKKTDPRQHIFFIWKHHTQKARVTRVIFDPSQPPGFIAKQKQPVFGRHLTDSLMGPQTPYLFKHFNMWEGLPFLSEPFADLAAVELELGRDEVERTLNLFLWHWLNVICAGDWGAFNYQVRWVAKKFELPWLCPEVALVTYGEQGLGKTLFWQFIGSLFGSASIYMAKPSQMTESQFGMGALTGHKAFCVVDEIKVPKGSRFEEEMKTMITANERNMEKKGRDPWQERNIMAFVFTTNHSDAFSANLLQRRMMVTNASRIVKDQGDGVAKQYFEIWAGHFSTPIAKMIIAAFFFSLSFSDQMKGWNPRCIFKTEAAIQMELQTFSPIEQWYYDQLLGKNSQEPPLQATAAGEDFSEYSHRKNLWEMHQSGGQYLVEGFFKLFFKWVTGRGLNPRPEEVNNRPLFWEKVSLFMGIDSPTKTPLPSRKRHCPEKNPEKFLLPSWEQRKKAWIDFKGWDKFV